MAGNDCVLGACSNSDRVIVAAHHSGNNTTVAGLPVDLDFASEFRYRDLALVPGTLALAVSQSGETADTLAATRLARELGCRFYADAEALIVDPDVEAVIVATPPAANYGCAAAALAAGAV